MEVFRDKLGRRIWFSVSHSQVQIVLQDLAEDFEYERTATVNDIQKICTCLNSNISNLENILIAKFGGKPNSFDLITDFFTENNIDYEYYSGAN